MGMAPGLIDKDPISQKKQWVYSPTALIIQLILELFGFVLRAKPKDSEAYYFFFLTFSGLPKNALRISSAIGIKETAIIPKMT